MRSATIAAVVLATTAMAAPLKNLVVLLADDLRPSLEPYIAPAVTPNIKAFASTALLFERAYTQFAVCAPSRSSFMSGRRPDVTRALNFRKSFRDAPGASSWLSWPEAFKETHVVLGKGKTYHEGLPPNFDVPYSWTNASDARGVPPSLANYLAYWLEKCPHGGAGGGWCVIPDSEEPTIFDYQLANQSVETLKALKAAQDAEEAAGQTATPFVLFAGAKKPHAPWGAPQRAYDRFNDSLPVAVHQHAPKDSPLEAFIVNFNVVDANGKSWPWNETVAVPDEVARENRKAYYATVSWLDEQFGKILDTLRDLDLEGDTVVVITADHGYALGEIGEWEKKALWELQTRVPFMIRSPDHPQSHGVKTMAFAELVDLYKTTLDLVGVGAPAKGQNVGGVSLKPVFEDPTSEGPNQYAISQYPRCGRIGTSDSCNGSPVNTFKTMGYSIRTPQWRYTAWFGWDQTALKPQWTNVTARELYDHQGDVGQSFDDFEYVNVAASNPTTVQQLHQVLLKAVHY